MTTPRIRLLIITGRGHPSRKDTRIADQVVVDGEIVKNKFGGLTIGEMRLTPKQREEVLRAMGKS